MDLTTATPLNKDGSIDPIFKTKLDLSTAMPADSEYVHLGETLANTDFVSTVRKAKNMQVDPTQIIKGAASSGVSLTVGAVGDNLAFAGRNIDAEEKTKTESILKKRSDPNYNWMKDIAWWTDSRDLLYQKIKGSDGKGAMTKIGQSIQDFTKGITDKYLAKKEGLANQLMYDLSGVGTSVAASFGLIGGLKALQATRAVQLSTPAGAFAAQAAGQVASTGDSQNASLDAQNKAYLESFAGNFTTEFIGGEIFLRTLKGSKIAERVAVNALSNAGQEGAQTFSDELAMKLNGFNRNDWDSISKNVAYSALLGSVAGGGVAGAHAVIEQRSIIGELRAAGLNDVMIETSFKELEKLPDVVKEGDLVKALVKNGFDEVSAQAVESKFADIGYKQWLSEGLGQVVKQLQQRGLNASEAFTVAEQLISQANKEAMPAIEEYLNSEMEKINQTADYQLAHEYFIKQMMGAYDPQAVDAKEREQQIVANAALSAKIAVNLAQKQNMKVEELLNVTIQKGEPVAVSAEQNAENAQVLEQPINPDIDINKTVPVITISNVGGKSDPKAIINHLKELSRQGLEVVKDNQLLRLLPKNVKHVVWSSAPFTKGETFIRHSTLNSLKDVMEASTLIETIPNKDKSKSDIKQYHRFYVPVSIDSKMYVVRLVGEETNQGIIFKDKAVDLYDLIIDKKEASSQHTADAVSGLEQEANKTVISIKQMLSGVKDSKGKTYFQSQENPRGKIEFTPKGNIISLYSKADPSTIMHEMAHHWLKSMADFISTGEADSQYLEWYGKLSNYLDLKEGEDITVEQHEKFARAFEQYLRDGSAPDKNLKPIFEAFKRWLSNVYKTAQSLDVELTPEAKSFFNELIAGETVIEGEEVDDRDTSWQNVLQITENDIKYNDVEEKILYDGAMAQDELMLKNEIRRYLYRKVSSDEIKTGEMQDLHKPLVWMFKKGGVPFDSLATEFFGLYPNFAPPPEATLGDYFRGIIKDLFVVNSYKDVVYRETIKEARKLVATKLSALKKQAKKEKRTIESLNAKLEAVSDFEPSISDIEANATDTVRRSFKAARRLASTMRVKARIDNTKKKYLDIIEQLRFKIKDIQRIKKQVADYATELLPKGQREKAFPLIKNAKSQKHLIEAFSRINEWADNANRAEIISEIKTLVDQIAKSESIDLGYKQQAEKELDRFDLESHSKRTIERISRMKQWADKHPDNAKITPDMAEQLDLLSKVNIRSLTESQLQGLKQKLVNIHQVGVTKQRVKERVRKIIKAQMLEGLAASTTKIESKDQITDPGNKLSNITHLKNTISDLQNGFTKMNISLTFIDTFFDNLDGGKGTFDGANYKMFKGITDYNFGRYLNLKDQYQIDILKLAQDLKLSQAEFERIGIYATLVQDGGYDKLQASLTPEQLAKALEMKLTTSEMTWYNAARAKLDEMRPLIEKLMRDEFNRPLGEVNNYFPFITNWKALDEVDIQDRFGAYAEKAIGEVMKKNPSMKFTIERKGGRIAVNLNALDVFLKHTDNVSYFLSMTKDNRILYEIAKSKDYKAIAGDIGAATTLNFIDTISRKGGTDISGRLGWLDMLRRNIGVGTLGFKLTTIFLQPTALVDTAGIIGDYAFKGAINITNDDWAKLVLQFPEIRRRSGDDPAYAEFLNNGGSPAFVWHRRLQEAGMKPIQKTDMWAAMAGAAGAYEKYMNDHNLPIDFENANKKAMAYAQLVVRLTQSSGFFKDSPQAVSRGTFSGNISLDKALFQFNNFALRRFGNIVDAARQVGNGDYNKGLTMLFWLLLSTIAGTGARAGIAAFKNLVTGDDKDYAFDKRLSMELISQLPVAGGVFAAMLSGYPSGVPVPALDVSGSLLKHVVAVTKSKKPEAKKKSAIRLAGVLGQISGIPGSAEISSIAAKTVRPNNRMRLKSRAVKKRKLKNRIRN